MTWSDSLYLFSEDYSPEHSLSIVNFTSDTKTFLNEQFMEVSFGGRLLDCFQAFLNFLDILVIALKELWLEILLPSTTHRSTNDLLEINSSLRDLSALDSGWSHSGHFLLSPTLENSLEKPKSDELSQQEQSSSQPIQEPLSEYGSFKQQSLSYFFIEKTQKKLL